MSEPTANIVRTASTFAQALVHTVSGSDLKKAVAEAGIQEISATPTAPVAPSQEPSTKRSGPRA
jgi:hypothetical protein